MNINYIINSIINWIIIIINSTIIIINSIIINFFIKRNKNNSCKEYLAVINYNNNFNSNYYIAIKQRKDNNNG